MSTRTTLSSLRLLGSVGEPINPEAWRWYRQTVGKDRVPVIDTWWQTETGGIMITTLPGAHAMQPGSAGRPFFGVRPQLVDAEGAVLVDEQTGGAAKATSASRIAGPVSAHHLWRSRPFRGNLFLDLQGQIFHRRRLSPRR
jgi:acetyl-CoA synthetase